MKRIFVISFIVAGALFAQNIKKVDNGKVLSSPAISDPTGTTTGVDVASPPDPASGKSKLYSKNGAWCTLTEDGKESCMNATGTPLPFIDDGSTVAFKERNLSIGNTVLVDSGNYASFTLACSAAVSKKAILLIAKAWNKLSTQTCSANLRFVAGSGGLLQPAAGAVVTLAGAIDANLVQVFDVSLGGMVTGMKSTELYPHWWGAVGDGRHNDRVALQAAIDVGSYGENTVRLPHGSYKISGGPLNIHSGANIIGSGRNFGCVLMLYDSAFISIDGTRSRVIGTDTNIYQLAGDKISYTQPPALGWSIAAWGKWATKINYHVGYTATGTDGLHYQCIKFHVSDSTNRPITGENSTKYWQVFRGIPWVMGAYYQGGDWNFRIHLSDFMIWPQPGNTATAALWINGVYNVQAHRINVFTFPNPYGIYIARANTVELQYPVVYGASTAKGIGIFVPGDSPATKLISPDVEASQYGIWVSSSAQVDIFSPYIERTQHGIKADTNAFGGMNSYGGTVSGNPDCFAVDGQNVSVYGAHTVGGNGVRSLSSSQLINTRIVGLSNDPTPGVPLINDIHGALDVQGGPIVSNSSPGNLYQLVRRQISHKVTVKSGDSTANLIQINILGLPNDGQVISGTIRFWAAIGNGAAVAMQKYAFALANNGSTLTVSNLAKTEDTSIGNSAYTLTFKGSIANPANTAVFRAMATAGGTIGAPTIDVYLDLEVVSNSANFSVGKY